jgi:hypothetical protein
VAVDDRLESLLPSETAPWPPPASHPIAHQMRVWDAWYVGDPDRLSWVYYNLGQSSPVGRSFFSTTGEPGIPGSRPGQNRGGLLGSVTRTFWGLPVPPGEKRTKLHVPVAADISQTSADLLFSKAPVVTAKSSANQAALEELMDDGMHATFLEAHELASALGGVYLRVVWDTDLSDRAWIDMVPADAALPVWSHNKLQAVTFWHVLSDTGKEVVRHLETHVPSQNAIFHRVHVGDQETLGSPRPLTDFEETRPLAAYLTDGDAITFPDMPLDASTVVYIPNMKPNRIWRGLGPQAAPLGRSDYSGAEGLMDALDETYSSWMRDVQLAKMRLLVPQGMLDNIGRGKGAVFEPDREVFSPVASMTGGSPQDIVANQFKIRFAEHQATCSDLVGKTIQAAGYSGQTFGEYDADGAPMTATEVEARERRSLITRDKKILYSRPPCRDILYGWLAVQAVMFHADVTPERPDLDFAEVVLPNMAELAQTASALSSAEAASKQTLVQMVHPDWTQAEVNEEVQRIYSEIGFDLANRARVMVSEPASSTATLTQQAQQLATQVEPPDLPEQVPGEELDQGGG